VSDALGTGASWPGVEITIETAIADAEIDLFHDLYEQAFGPLRARAIAR
jgi:hypothetical protein